MVATRESESAPTNRTSMQLASDRELVISRTFDAPARIVFNAWTKPELVRRWWAPASHCVSIVDCDANVRVGGTYRYVIRRDTGQEFAFSGTYTELTPYTRMVYTQIFEPMRAAGAVTITLKLDEGDGKTHLVLHSLYPSTETLQATIASGMEHGMRETMDQLDELVASLV